MRRKKKENEREEKKIFGPLGYVVQKERKRETKTNSRLGKNEGKSDEFEY